MERYTIYCTEKQTRAALALGAPITKVQSNVTLQYHYKTDEHDRISKLPIWLTPPTAEQMIGWLEEQEEIGDIVVLEYGMAWWADIYPTLDDYITLKGFNSRKEATLAAIDAALEYLEQKGGKQ